MDGEEDIGRFALSPIGLRFLVARVEDDYRAWHVRQVIPFTRIGMLLVAGSWLLIAAITPSVAVGHVAATLAGVGVILAVAAWTLVISYRPHLIRWTLPSMAVSATVGGTVGVAACYWTFGIPAYTNFAVAVAAFFGFTIARLRPGLATIAAVPYVILNQILLWMGYRTGEVSWTVVVLGWAGTAIVLISGSLACMVIDRVSRQAYRQERINEVQQRAIESERARADVAERSREMWSALSRLAAGGATTDALRSNDVIAERYRVIRALGAGGMGEVHEVERLSDRRRFALKMLTRATHRDALMRFAREAEIAAKLDHPHVVGVFDVGVSPAGMFLVMELIADAATLAGVARGDRTAALELLRQIADALAAMHALAIVHRDLKPANILIANGRAKVADFGIASLRDATAIGVANAGPASADAIALAETGASDATQLSISLTRTGTVLGTPLYMAPELVRGARDAEPPSDLWSFGVIAFELLANRLPFVEPPFVARLSGRSPAQPESFERAGLAPDLVTLLDRCLAIDPAARPTAAAIRDALAKPA